MKADVGLVEGREELHRSGSAMLHRTLRLLSQAHIFGAMDELMNGLRACRSKMNATDWHTFSHVVCRRHELRGLIHQAPLTRRAFDKPRGYPGDAVTLDYIYDRRQLPGGLSRLGSALSVWEHLTHSCRSVRARKERLTTLIDETADRFPRSKVLSVACGHAREVRLSRAVADGRLATFVALDQDRKSLDVVAGDYPQDVFKPLQGTVRGLLGRRYDLPRFHLTYSAGLFDYLADDVAAALTRRLFDTLEPGGRLVIVDFTPDLRDIGYLEAFMDWHLIYRTETDLLRIAAALDAGAVATVHTYRDTLRNLAFLEVTRR